VECYPSMKTRPFLRLFIPCFVLLADPCFAATPASPYPPVPFGALRIQQGMTRADVRSVFGEPSAVLSAEICAYYDLRFLTTPGASACDAMVLRFREDRVVEIRLCASAPVREFVAREERRKQAARNVASN
jgi:hypothetical protein